MTWLLLVLVVVVGLPVGWACAWWVHRYHDDEETDTAILGDAGCAQCDATLAPGPTMVRLGSCPSCGARVPATWWVTALAVPLAGAVMVLTWSDVPAVLVAYLWLVPVATVAAMVDVRLMLIPKKVVWVGLGVGVTLVAATTVFLVATDRYGTDYSVLVKAAVGSAFYFGLLYVVWFLVPRGMGFGDVRFASVLGLYLGWVDPMLVFYGLLLGSVVGVVIGLVVRLLRADRFFPFGPGMALGALAAIVLRDVLL